MVLGENLPLVSPVVSVKACKQFIWREMDDLDILLHHPLKSPNDAAIYVMLSLSWIVSYQMELMKMASKKVSPRSDSTWLGFVNVDLSTDSKETFKAWDLESDDVWVLLSDTIVSGHKLSLSYNKQNDNFVATLTGLAGHKTNAGYSLSGFAKDWYTALRVLLFKHSIMCDGDWSNHQRTALDEIG